MHEGHRAKMRERIARNGMDSLAEHEVLETLLYFMQPRGDTNPIAHRLIARFGNFAGVLDAPVQELLTVEGVGNKTAEFLSALPDYLRHYLLSRQRMSVLLNTPEKIGQYLAPYFIGMQEELVMVLCLDNNCRATACRVVHHGSVNAVEVNLRSIVQMALENNAVGIVLAHNHPGGLAVPSSDDLHTTACVREALVPLHITLVDHIILAPPADGESVCDYISLSESGYMDAALSSANPQQEQKEPQ